MAQHSPGAQGVMPWVPQRGVASRVQCDDTAPSTIPLRGWRPHFDREEGSSAIGHYQPGSLFDTRADGQPSALESPGRSRAGGKLGQTLFGSTQTLSTDVPSEVDVLQRRVDMECSGKEAAKSELISTARALEVHVRQILVACSTAQSPPTQACVDRVLRNVAAFGDELEDKRSQWEQERGHGANDARSASADTMRSYDILRHSLNSTQKRCASLNDDMLRVADANEELMSTMQAVKSTNRRLVDQIQSQSEEIARLTQLRLMDEGKIEEVSQKNRMELERLRRDLDQRVVDAEAEYEVAYKARQDKLRGQLLRMQTGLRLIGAKLAELRKLQIAIASEAKVSFGQWRVDVLDRLGRQLSNRLDSTRRDNEAITTRLEDEVHAWQAKLDVERETRRRENDMGRDREREHDNENLDVVTSAEGDVSRLRADIDALNASRKAEARTTEREREERAEQLRDLAVQVASLSVMFEGSKAVAATLETQRMRNDSEKQRLDEAWSAAQSALRESDSALDHAVASNEELRRLMDAQRTDAHNQCDEKLSDIARQREETYAQLRGTQQQEAADIAIRIQRLEEEAAERAAEVVRQELEIERATAERAALQRDCALWRAQGELAQRLRGEVERELERARSDWARHLADLREQQDALTAKQLTVEDQLRSSKAAFAEYKASAEQRAADTRDKARALGDKFQQADDALGSTKRALHEKAALLATIKSEASARRAAALEARHDLEKKLQLIEHDATATRELFHAEVTQEWQKAHRAQKDCEDSRQRGQLVLQEAQNGPLAQISLLEESLAELRERQTMDARNCDAKAEAKRMEIEGLEAELCKLQAQLDETERRLQVDTAQMRHVRGEHGSLLEQLRLDSVSAKERAAQVHEQQSRLVSELDEMQRAASLERARQERELADLTRSCEHQAREAKARLEAERQRWEAELGKDDQRLRMEVDRQRLALEATEAENRRLRRIVGETRTQGAGSLSAAGAVADALGGGGANVAAGAAASPSFSTEGPFGGSGRAFRGDVEESLKRMQRRTEQLRRDVEQNRDLGTAALGQ